MKPVSNEVEVLLPVIMNNKNKQWTKVLGNTKISSSFALRNSDTVPLRKKKKQQKKFVPSRSKLSGKAYVTGFRKVFDASEV